ncbi:stress-induced protein [Pseudomonas sp. S75]|uniref:general stress protein n=1 Tax=unclassified Pseudomonas TaxID=196821 RepID=UPI00190885FF|nr:MULTISPECIES: KGG domain-containing protein [unclassified Pseudomonas]MBJ9977688.1 stress-induced protein [Pseudomonas sp. S30]MBK0155060.1 stress-induced protein [Pseudomonas sp. S75]
MANNQSKPGSQGGNTNSGNFANDREKASEAGRKSGQSSSGGKKGDTSHKGGRS